MDLHELEVGEGEVGEAAECRGVVRDRLIDAD